ncbi:MAG: hypothetical protein ACYDAJ_12075 [Nitrosotalea sp.]
MSAGEMVPFWEKFPEIAANETRGVIITNEKTGLPLGHYYFLESFCNDKKCDCRRVFINVEHDRRILTTIGYGWESIEFYKKWFGTKGSEKAEIIRCIKGPVTEFCRGTQYEKKLLDFFRDFLINDPVFMERLKKHYKLFKGF